MFGNRAMFCLHMALRPSGVACGVLPWIDLLLRVDYVIEHMVVHGARQLVAPDPGIALEGPAFHARVEPHWTRPRHPIEQQWLQ